MASFQKLGSGFVFLASLVVFLVLQPVGSSQEHVKSRGDSTHDKLSSKLVFEIKIHGFLLWASMGFLVPVGILAIRMSNREECRGRLKILIYVHAILQIVSTIVATVGAVMSFRNFNNAFNNNHQRIGLALYGLIWLQSLIGVVRPQRGSKRRGTWFSAHWLLGTVVSVLGVFNVYSGLQAFHEKTSKSVRIWIIAFSVEISVITLFYLLQDKWEYLQKHRVTFGDDIITPTDHLQKDQFKDESC